MFESLKRHPLVAMALILWLAMPPPVFAQAGESPITGEFTVTIAVEDVPQDLIDGASLIGLWQITFNPDGTYARGRQDVGTLAAGQFAIEGDRMILSAESGLLACPGGEDEGGSATYSWEITGDKLRLVAVEEPCASRRLLLTTRTLSLFTACLPPTQALDLPQASSPPARDVDATSESAGLELLGPQPTPDAVLDDLLRRMSTCWATRDPAQFLPLVSMTFQDELVGARDDSYRRFAQTMAQAIVWERVGEVEMVDRNHVAATVRQTSGDEIDYVRYLFAYEDGAWRWAGPDVTP